MYQNKPLFQKTLERFPNSQNNSTITKEMDNKINETKINIQLCLSIHFFPQNHEGSYLKYSKLKTIAKQGIEILHYSIN